MHCSIRHVALVSLLSVAGLAVAHGDWAPRHGGIMNDGGETSFELVGRGPKVVLYVEDHGTPVETLGAKGVFNVTRGNGTWSAEIKAVRSNQLQAELPRKLIAGDKVLAQVTMGNGSVTAARFVIK